jgi:hypothetical protein
MSILVPAGRSSEEQTRMMQLFDIKSKFDALHIKIQHIKMTNLVTFLSRKISRVYKRLLLYRIRKSDKYIKFILILFYRMQN